MSLLEFDQIESYLRAKLDNPDRVAVSGLPRRCTPRKDERTNPIELKSSIVEVFDGLTALCHA